MKVKHHKYWYSIFKLVLASFHFILSSLSDCIGGWICALCIQCWFLCPDIWLQSRWWHGQTSPVSMLWKSCFHHFWLVNKVLIRQYLDRRIGQGHHLIQSGGPKETREKMWKSHLERPGWDFDEKAAMRPQQTRGKTREQITGHLAGEQHLVGWDQNLPSLVCAAC